MKMFALRFFSSLDELQQGNGSAEISAQFEHLLVARLVVLTILAGLHFFRTTTKRQIRVVRGRTEPMLRFYREQKRVLLKIQNQDPLLFFAYVYLFGLSVTISYNFRNSQF